MVVFLNLLAFLKEPSIVEFKRFHKKSILRAFRQFIIFDLLLLFIWGSINAFLIYIFDDLHNLITNRNISNHQVLSRFFIVTILAPILEELTFRLWLRVNKINVSISLAVFIALILKITGVLDVQLWIRVFLILPIGIFLYYILSELHLSILKKRFKVFVYFNFVSFGILHAFNYNFINFTDYFFIPHLIFTQIALGIYLSYSRLKYGFIYALLIHVFHNSFLQLLGVIF